MKVAFVVASIGRRLEKMPQVPEPKHGDDAQEQKPEECGPDGIAKGDDAGKKGADKEGGDDAAAGVFVGTAQEVCLDQPFNGRSRRDVGCAVRGL